ncbi:MAG: hypothetical protein LHV68_00595 [Elusimicrobia bacterium]|nr:hypothetical protein [Candidatus Liberimonas magnetica]
MKQICFRRLFYFILVPVLLAGCATTTNYYDNLNKLLTQGKFSDAVALNEGSKDDIYGKKNALLYYLDRGMLLHYNGNYTESSLSFEKAKKYSEEYFTKSITTEASTLLISDNMRPYYGEDFEQALVRVFCAINYIFLNQEDDALVEARQVDQFLKTLKVNYGFKDVYTEDAFVRYLMGMLYENKGEINDAFISYRQALDAYKYYVKNYGVSTPKELVYDALKTAKKLGFSDEIREIEQEYQLKQKDTASAGGELVVIHYNGLCPVKIDHFFEISFGKGWVYVENMDVKGEEEQQVEQARAIVNSIASDEQIRLAFPKYVRENYAVQNLGVKVTALNGLSSTGVMAEDIGAIAIKGLEDRINRIRAKTIARGVIKFVLAQKVTSKVKESSGEVSAWFAKTLLKTVSAATEASDKRSWRSLPDKINLARISLPEGTHSVEVKFYDKSNNEVKNQVLNNIKIVKGKKTFVALRTAN